MAKMTTEQRIAKMARATAKLVCELRRQGEEAAALKLSNAAIEAAELMRAGRL